MSSGSANSNGKRRRVSGILTSGARGYSILTKDGDLWIIDRDEIDSDLIGHMVTVEGTLTGLDRLKLDWIGEASN